MLRSLSRALTFGSSPAADVLRGEIKGASKGGGACVVEDRTGEER